MGGNSSIKKPYVLIDEADPDYARLPRSIWVKKRLREHGPYGEHLSAAREILKYHEDEVKLIRKYMRRALNEFQNDMLVYSSDEGGFEPVIQKRQRTDDIAMNKE